MRVALISSFDFHMCCIGFLLELFKEHKIDVYFPDDREGYYSYYKSLYPNTETMLCNPSTFVKENYDQCIKVTSNDTVISSNGIISISHLKLHSDNYNKYISMTPWIKGENIKYIFPIYRGLKNKEHKNIITYIGWFLPNYLDEDTKKLINALPEYTFNFFGGHHQPEFNNMKNVNCTARRINTHELVESIKESKFILIRKEPFQLNDRYSGALGHAVSHCKPMIIQKYSSDSYGLPGIVFEKEYCEVIDKIKNITDEEYETHIKELEEFSERTFSSNSETLKNLLN